MKRLVFALFVAVVALAGLAFAQPIPTLSWDHDGVNVTHFTCQIDAGAQVDLSLPVPIGTAYSVPLTSCGAIANGQHTLTIRACNLNGCTAAAAIYVVKL